MKQSLHFFLLGLYVLPQIGWAYTAFNKKYKDAKIKTFFASTTMIIYLVVITLNYFKF